MIKLVFHNYKYIVLAAVIFVGMVIPLSIISEFLFLQPFVIAHIPNGGEISFLLIIVVSALSGLVLSMNVYRINSFRNSPKKKLGGGLFGSIIGAAAGACSCGPIGFAVISIFGTAGGIATAFLTNYEIPIRLVAIGILVYTYYATVKSLALECKVKS
ncbi:MAG TPA: hypothetical protein VD731_06975 [Nitrosopumilaceae archaeon]|nr:hypothetical protein [Nitrosopumilaceae archaeon]